MQDANKSVQHTVNLSFAICHKTALYEAYMSFVKQGGLFIPTNDHYQLGDMVFLLLNLMGETEKLPILSKVIWITPREAQNNRAAGIGVQFQGENAMKVRNKIEMYLGGVLESDKYTNTM